MTGNRRSWKNLWCERRGQAHHKMIAALILYLLVWFTAVGYAASSMAEHADDIISLEWKIIIGILSVVLVLVGIIQGLVSYIYITGMKDLKASVEKLFENDAHLADTKLDKTDHTILCGKVNRP